MDRGPVFMPRQLPPDYFPALTISLLVTSTFLVLARSAFGSVTVRTPSWKSAVAFPESISLDREMALSNVP